MCFGFYFIAKFACPFITWKLWSAYLPLSIFSVCALTRSLVIIEVQDCFRFNFKQFEVLLSMLKIEEYNFNLLSSVLSCLSYLLFVVYKIQSTFCQSFP